MTRFQSSIVYSHDGIVGPLTPGIVHKDVNLSTGLERAVNRYSNRARGGHVNGGDQGGLEIAAAVKR